MEGEGDQGGGINMPDRQTISRKFYLKGEEGRRKEKRAKMIQRHPPMFPSCFIITNTLS